jgi:hypothetical protein
VPYLTDVALHGHENSKSTRPVGADMARKRKVIVHIATGADAYIARPDGRLDRLTSRPASKGFYGMPEFARSVDAKLLGRKTFDLSVEMGATFSAHDRHYVFSRQPPLHPCPLAWNSSLGERRRCNPSVAPDRR